MLITCLSATCTVLVVLLILKTYRTATYWKKSGIPHESFCAYLYYYFFEYHRVNIFDSLEEYTKKFGPIYGTYQGLKPVLRITNADYIKEALVWKFLKVHGRSVEVATGCPLWDNNILALDYDMWKVVRPLTSQVVTGSKLRFMISKSERVGKRLQVKLNELAKDNSEIQCQDYARSIIMDSSAAMMFNLNVDALEDPNNIFVKHSSGIFDPSFGLNVFLFVPHLIKYLPFIHFPRRESSKFFVDFATTLLKQRRQLTQKPADPDVLDLWLEVAQRNPEIKDKILISQIFIFFVAGYETSAYTLMFLMHLLATHPKTQNEVYKNIVDNVSDPNDVTYDDYKKMKLLEACIFETLRLYPSDFTIDRITVKPCSLAGVSLDKGVGVQIPVSAVHRDPERFPEPLKFKPERFLEDKNAYKHLLAFGDGPKNCPGERLAITNIMVVLATILRTVRFEPVADLYDPSLEYQPVIERVPGQAFLPFPKKNLRVKIAPRL